MCGTRCGEQKCFFSQAKDFSPPNGAAFRLTDVKKQPRILKKRIQKRLFLLLSCTFDGSPHIHETAFPLSKCAWNKETVTKLSVGRSAFPRPVRRIRPQPAARAAMPAAGIPEILPRHFIG